MKTKKILKKVQACFLSAALICACLAAIPMQAFAAEDPPISLDQNFDNDFQLPTEALGAAKSTGAWYLQGSTNSVKVEVADVTDTNTVDNGGGSGKAVKFTNKSGDTNNQGIAYLFRNSSSTKLTTGKFRISGSIYATGRNPFVLELLGINGSSFQNVEVLKTGYSNLMTWDNDTDKVVYGLGTEVHCGDLFPLLKDFTPNTWYDYSIILDLDQDPAVYHVTLSHDGRAIAQIRDRKLLSGGTGSTITDNFAGIRFRSWNLKTDTLKSLPDNVYLDNIKVEQIDSDSANDRVVSEDNFDALTTPPPTEDPAALAADAAEAEAAADATATPTPTARPTYTLTGWTQAERGDDRECYTVADDPLETGGSDKVMKLGGTKRSGADRTIYFTSSQKDTTYSDKGKTLESGKASGKYKFTYKIYTPKTETEEPTSADVYVGSYAGNWNTDKAAALAFVRNGKIHHTNIGVNSDIIDDAGKHIDARNGWVTVETIVDFDAADAEGKKTGKMYYTVTQDGYTATAAVSGIPNISANGNVDLDANYFQNFNVRNIGTKGDAYIDDFKVEYCPVYVGGVTLADATGKAVTSGSKNSPILKTVTLDLGGDIDDATLSGITLKNGDSDIAFTGELKDGKYVMTINTLPLAAGTYKINVPAALANKAGDAMLQEYNYEFTVAEAKPFANITAVKSSDGTKITYLEDLNETENLQVDVSYMFPEAKDKIECIAAYYKDDMLLQCDPIDVDTKSDYTKTATFTLPGEDVLGQATSVKILLWDSLTNMVPYDKAYVIEPAPEPDPSESPSASASAIPAD